MLDKQLARAAIDRKKVTFMVNLGSNHEVSGYIAGIDSYTVMVVVPTSYVPDKTTYKSVATGTTTTFVHKSAAVIKISSTESLDDESEFVRDEVTKIGSSFWRSCQQRYLGHTNTEQETAS